MIAGQLSDRQRQLLFRVVEEYVATRQPVGSKTLVARGALPVSSSTIRAALADLERLGMLTHPHTSAGRVPTEAGYRAYVDELLARKEPRPGDFPRCAAPAEAGSPIPQPTATKAYGADDAGALDRLLETNGGDGNPSR